MKEEGEGPAVVEEDQAEEEQVEGEHHSNIQHLEQQQQESKVWKHSIYKWSEEWREEPSSIKNGGYRFTKLNG